MLNSKQKVIFLKNYCKNTHSKKDLKDLEFLSKEDLDYCFKDILLNENWNEKDFINFDYTKWN